MVTELKIETREEQKTGRALRREGKIPATLYGPEIDATNIQLSAKDFSHIAFADYTHLINLKEDGKEDHEVLIKNIQRDYVTRDVLSLQFYKVKRGHKVTMKVALNFVGESQAVKMGADFVPVHKEVNIRCLPRHIPYSVDVDISNLNEAGDHVSFDQLVVNAEEIEILDPGKEIICKVELKRIDHTIDPEPSAAEGEAAEGEAGAEGAAAEGEKKEEAKAE